MFFECMEREEIAKVVQDILEKFWQNGGIIKNRLKT